jgi:hypothetical protein
LSRHATWLSCIAALACGDVTPRRQPERPPTPQEPDLPHEASITLRVGGQTLAPAEETTTCWSRTLHNEQPLWVEAVTFSNLGAFHHSNWFIVPEDVYEGSDGAWDCAERGFQEQSAALSGGVLFAQSTQAWNETMRFDDGVVIKIPPRSKIVADLHLLNLAMTERETEGWLTLDVVHPWFVTTVLKPMMLAYYDLEIPPVSESRFFADCDGLPPIELHYVLPHYHAMGNFFSLELVDDRDVAIPVYETQGFSADAAGVTFPEPVSFGAYDRLRFTCGYDNWLPETLTWGIGQNEMCVMLGLISSTDIVTGVVLDGRAEVDPIDGIRRFEGDCQVLTATAGEAYAAPRVGELGAPLYLPPVDPQDEGSPVVPECVDADTTAIPAAEATLDNLRDYVFEPWCTFSSCHGEGAAGGIDLRAQDLEAQLHTRIEPGDPDASILYQVMSQCEPDSPAGHMPRNAPVLLDDSLVAMVRAWIENLPAE